MKVQRYEDLKPYNVPGHYNMVPLRVHGRETSDSEILTVGLSHFLPGGGAESSEVKEGTELVYYVTTGQLTVFANGQTITLRSGDSVFLKAGDIRAVRNETTAPASMLVIMGRK